MNIQLIQVPYDSGQEGLRTGAGPSHLLDHGLADLLSQNGHQASVDGIRSDLSLPTENATTFDVIGQLATHVHSAVKADRFPLILAGNCNSSVGVLAGLGASRTGVIWFDAHGDFNTPETTSTGFLDGMGLAMASGRCWQSILKNLPGFEPVPDDCIVHVGARDLDPPEKEMFAQAGIPLITGNLGDLTNLVSRLEKALQPMARKVDGVCLHIDLDVLDVGDAKPNHLAVPGGVAPEHAVEAIHAIKRHVPLAAATIASYDPSLDPHGRVRTAAVELLQAIVD